MNKTLLIVWVGCAVLNIYSVAYNSAKEKDYSMFIPAMIFGIAFAPIATIIGFATIFGSIDRNSKGDKNGS
jgi:hypothetical protein